jgi:hypothetical protein
MTMRSSRKRDPELVRGPNIAAARWHRVATTPFAGGARGSAAGGGGPGRPPPPEVPSQRSPKHEGRAPLPAVTVSLGHHQVPDP